MTGTAADIQPPSHGLGAFMQAFKPEGFGFFEHGWVDALAVVGHFQRQHVLLVGEINVYRFWVRVFGDVGQRFLRRAIGNQLDICGCLDGFAAAYNTGWNAGAAFKSGGKPPTL